jgi:hypothetical protein
MKSMYEKGSWLYPINEMTKEEKRKRENAL